MELRIPIYVRHSVFLISAEPGLGLILIHSPFSNPASRSTLMLAAFLLVGTFKRDGLTAPKRRGRSEVRAIRNLGITLQPILRVNNTKGFRDAQNGWRKVTDRLAARVLRHEWHPRFSFHYPCGASFRASRQNVPIHIERCGGQVF
jgi:hypothetical protein